VHILAIKKKLNSIYFCIPSFLRTVLRIRIRQVNVVNVSALNKSATLTLILEGFVPGITMTARSPKVIDSFFRYFSTHGASLK
jgi:hypothetical protein